MASTSPVDLPFLPFEFFSSGISSTPVPYPGRTVALNSLRLYFAAYLLPSLHIQIRTRIAKVTRLPLRPFKQLRHIHDNLPIRRQLHSRAVHRTRRWPLKVDPFTVVPAAVAGAFEFVLAGFPIRRAPQMRAARVYHEHAVRSAVHPNPILLLPLRIDTQGIVGRIPNLENGRRFKKCTWKEKTQKGDKPSPEKTRNSAPHKPAPPLIDSTNGWTHRRHTRRWRCFRGTHRRRAHKLCSFASARSSRLRCIRFRIGRI